MSRYNGKSQNNRNGNRSTGNQTGFQMRPCSERHPDGTECGALHFNMLSNREFSEMFSGLIRNILRDVPEELIVGEDFKSDFNGVPVMAIIRDFIMERKPVKELKEFFIARGFTHGVPNIVNYLISTCPVRKARYEGYVRKDIEFNLERIRREQEKRENEEREKRLREEHEQKRKLQEEKEKEKMKKNAERKANRLAVREKGKITKSNIFNFTQELKNIKGKTVETVGKRVVIEEQPEYALVLEDKGFGTLIVITEEGEKQTVHMSCGLFSKYKRAMGLEKKKKNKGSATSKAIRPGTLLLINDDSVFQFYTKEERAKMLQTEEISDFCGILDINGEPYIDPNTRTIVAPSFYESDDSDDECIGGGPSNIGGFYANDSDSDSESDCDSESDSDCESQLDDPVDREISTELEKIYDDEEKLALDVSTSKKSGHISSIIEGFPSGFSKAVLVNLKKRISVLCNASCSMKLEKDKPFLKVTCGKVDVIHEYLKQFKSISLGSQDDDAKSDVSDAFEFDSI